MSELFQPSPSARNQSLLLTRISLIKLPFVEWAFNRHWLKIGIDNELRERRIAPNMPLARRMQRLRIDLTNYISQVQVTLKDMLDIAAANVTEISSFAAHGRQSLRLPSS